MSIRARLPPRQYKNEPKPFPPAGLLDRDRAGRLPARCCPRARRTDGSGGSGPRSTRRLLPVRRPRGSLPVLPRPRIQSPGPYRRGRLLPARLPGPDHRPPRAGPPPGGAPAVRRRRRYPPAVSGQTVGRQPPAQTFQKVGQVGNLLDRRAARERQAAGGLPVGQREPGPVRGKGPGAVPGKSAAGQRAGPLSLLLGRPCVPNRSGGIPGLHGFRCALAPAAPFPDSRERDRTARHRPLRGGA